jgi:hypothetical protein
MDLAIGEHLRVLKIGEDPLPRQAELVEDYNHVQLSSFSLKTTNFSWT